MELKDMFQRALIGDYTVLDDYPEEALEVELDVHGWNAYHLLAQSRRKQILKFTGAYKLRNKKGETAVDILLKNFEINEDVLKQFFPWYTVVEGDTIEESLQKIRETSSAEKFILSL